MHGRALDWALAGGADPGSSPEPAIRAQKLTSRAHRRAIADSFDEAVSVAEGREPRISAAPPLATREIRAARAALIQLARTLRDEGTVSAEGVALAQELLSDGCGPLYVSGENHGLWRAARRATEALRAGG